MGNNINNLGAMWPTSNAATRHFILKRIYRGIKGKRELLYRDTGHGDTPMAWSNSFSACWMSSVRAMMSPDWVREGPC